MNEFDNNNIYYLLGKLSAVKLGWAQEYSLVSFDVHWVQDVSWALFLYGIKYVLTKLLLYVFKNKIKLLFVENLGITCCSNNYQKRKYGKHNSIYWSEYNVRIH